LTKMYGMKFHVNITTLIKSMHMNLILWSMNERAKSGLYIMIAGFLTVLALISGLMFHKQVWLIVKEFIN